MEKAVSYKAAKGNLWVMEIFHISNRFVKTHRIIYLKRVNFTVYKFNKP